MTFDLDRFIEACRGAVATDQTHRSARDILARAVADPAAVLQGLGEPQRAGIETLYTAPDLTILNVVWGPLMSVPPHNHDMWAVIGIYAGREDNIFWRQIDTENGSIVEAAGAKSLAPGDAEPLGREIVHSVLNPTERLAAAIHVYGGDFFGVERHEWDPETHRRRAFDIENTRRRFENSNRLLG